ncbi:MAG: hypothetical protein RL640_560 [Bacteroidota bacterium]|jgi:hypothetical protein
MKFQEGDKIIVIATGEHGAVVEWINKKMLTIDVGGVQFPVYADQIDFPYFDAFTKKKSVPTKKSTSIEIPNREKKPVRNIPRDGVHLSFFPILDKDVFDEDVFSHYRVYILNHTDDRLMLHFRVFFKEQKELETKHAIAALEDLYLFDMSFDRLNDHPVFNFDFSLEQANSQKASHHAVSYKPRPKQILTLSEKTVKEHNASFSFVLFQAYPEKGMEVSAERTSDLKMDTMVDGSIDLSQLLKAGFKVQRKR